MFLCTVLSMNYTCFAAEIGNYVDVNKVWHIRFNMDINKSTVNSDNVLVLDENQSTVPIKISCGEDRRSIDVAPVNSYVPGKTYSLIINKDIRAVSGQSIGNPKKLNFNIADKSDSKLKVCIDAGFGGSDPGQIGKAGGKESSINLAVALKLGKVLENRGIQVLYTRTSDVSVDSAARFKVANDSDADYFISIHCNASDSNKAASGIETYYLDGNAEEKKAAENIQAQLIKSTSAVNRGAKPGKYAELKSTDAPGVKVYLGFMSTPSDEKLLINDDFQNKCAAAIADGIAASYSGSSGGSSSIPSDTDTDSDSLGDTDAKPNDIISYAYTFLGIPYLSGGTTTKGFDCSGFVQYVYAHFGIKLRRDTYSQIKQGIPVDKAKLMPGDLIFFGTTSDPGHVGIYVGNNSFIHSPRTGESIKITQLKDMTDYLCARRILK